MATEAEGRRAWVVLVGCLVCQIGLGLGGYIFVVFLKPIVAEFGWARATFAGSGLPLLAAMAGASPVVGHLTDRLGPRTVFASGIVIVALGLMGLSVMEELWQFYALGALLGIGATALGDIPAGAIVSQWFQRQRGLALGLTYIGSNIGGAIVPIVATSIAAESSWRVALRVLAVGGLVTILPFALFAVRAAPGAVATPEAPSSDDPSHGVTLAEARRTGTFWLLVAVVWSFYFYYLGVNNHLVAFLSDRGFTDAAAARHFSAAVAVGIAGKIGMGLVADRIPIRAAMLANFGLMALGSLALLAVGRWPGLLPWFLGVHGFTVAAENVLLPLVVGWAFGVRHLAQIYGAIMLTLLPGGVMGNVFAAHVFDVTGSYWPAFATFAVVNVLVVVGIARMRPAVVAAVVVAAMAFHPATASAARHRIQFDPRSVTVAAEVDPRFLSVAVDMDQVVGGTFWDPAGGPEEVDVAPYDFTRPVLRALAAPLAPAYLRIGGSASDRTFYDLSPAPVSVAPEPYREVLTAAQWNAASAFASDLGFALILTVNAGAGPRDEAGVWTDANARALLESIAASSEPLALLEFGNEPNLFAARAGVPGYDADDYARDLATFVALRDAVLPATPIGGPGSIFTRGQADDVLPGVALGPRAFEMLPLVGSMLDVVEYHYYAAVSERCPPSGPRVDPTTALEAAYLDGIDEPVGIMHGLRDLHAPGAPVWMTESGGQSCGGQLGVADRFVNAFWFLTTLGRMARAGEAVFVRQTLSGGTYGLIDDATLVPRPDYWAALLWRQLMGTRVLAFEATTLPATARVFAHCTRGGESGDVTLLVLNADVERSLRIRVRRGRLRTWVASASDAEGTGVRLNGEVLAPDASGEPPVLASRLRRGSVKVPRASYAFVIARGAAPEACPGEP